jgi:hypothetical protein
MFGWAHMLHRQVYGVWADERVPEARKVAEVASVPRYYRARRDLAFSTRYPEAAAVFENLHALHDVVSDILTDPAVPRRDKRRRILEAAAAYRDDTTAVTTADEWRAMAHDMGVGEVGGVAFPLPVPFR